MSQSFDDPAMAAWVEQARAVTTLEAAQSLGFRPLRKGQASVWLSGACVSCGTTGSRNPRASDRFSVGVRGGKSGAFSCRSCGIRGGDGIGLLQQARGLSFMQACEALAGPPPRGTVWTAEERAAWRAKREKLAEERAERDRIAAAEAAGLEEEKRRQAMALWPAGQRWPGTPVEHYLRLRRIRPGNLQNLRYHPALKLRTEAGAVAHEGPCMMALVEGPDGRAIGVHRTWLDLERPPKFRPSVLDPDTGEPVPTKKMLGGMRGGVIRLIDGPEPRRIVLAEGIETLLSVHTALTAARSPLLGRACFWCAVSMDNIPIAIESRPRPATALDLVVLGDGDTHRPTIERVMALCRVAAGRAGYATIRIAMSPQGADFNDLLTGDGA